MSCTTVRFVDTNVVLYAVTDVTINAARRRRAAEVLAADDLVFSAQVLQEFYVQATRSTRPDRLTDAEALGFVRSSPTSPSSRPHQTSC